MNSLKQHFDNAWRKHWGLPKTHQSTYDWEQETEAVKAFLDELRENRPGYVSYDDWNIFIDEVQNCLADKKSVVPEERKEEAST